MYSYYFILNYNIIHPWIAINLVCVCLKMYTERMITNQGGLYIHNSYKNFFWISHNYHTILVNKYFKKFFLLSVNKQVMKGDDNPLLVHVMQVAYQQWCVLEIFWFCSRIIKNFYNWHIIIYYKRYETLFIS